jgi:chemotaxis signal transduction protein
MIGKHETADQGCSERMVAVRSAAGTPEAENMMYIFTTGQVEDVLADLPVCPVPFTPPFVCGVCKWRKYVVPVIDLEQRLGIGFGNSKTQRRFMVVRTAVADDETGSRMLHYVLKVSDRISTLDISGSDSILSEEVSGINGMLTRGVFRYGDDMLVAPDLLTLLDMENCFDKGE